MKVRRLVTRAQHEIVFGALRNDTYLKAIANAALLVDSRLDHAAILIVGELARRGHYRTPCGLSSYSFKSVRAALIGWPT